jgi:FixJ family two-component response regulator
MPGITGLDLANQMLHLRPEIPIILCTGHSSLIFEEQVKTEGVKAFAMKPLTINDLALLLRKILDE